MNRPNRVVVGSTLGPASDGVVATAIEVAAAIGAEAHVVHALSSEIEGGPFAIDRSYWKRLEEIREERRAALAQQIARLGGRATAHIEDGAPHRALLEIAARLRASLLVVGGERIGWHGIGATTDRVVRGSTCDVLVVRGRLSTPPRRVVFPVDLSEISAEGLRNGLRVLERLGEPAPKATALYVLTDAQLRLCGRADDRAAGRGSERLAAFVAANAGDSIVPVGSNLRIGDPAREILEEIRREDADLAVLATHGSGGFERSLLGGVAFTVLDHASCSVLLIPPGAAAIEAARSRLESVAIGPSPAGWFA